MQIDWEQVALIISILLGIGSATSQWWVARKKANATELVSKGDAADRISEAALELLLPYKKEVSELAIKLNYNKERIDNCLDNYRQLSIKYDQLSKENRSLKLEHRNNLFKITQLENSESELKETISKLNLRNTQLGIKINQLEEENSQMRKSRNQMQQTIEYLSSERTRLENELIEIKQLTNGESDKL